MLQRVGELQAQTEELKPEDKSHDEMSHEDGKSPVLTEKTQANDIDELHEEVTVN